jgi:hypothetical protein
LSITVKTKKNNFGKNGSWLLKGEVDIGMSVNPVKFDKSRKCSPANKIENKFQYDNVDQTQWEVESQQSILKSIFRTKKLL